jgi:threonine synthase
MTGSVVAGASHLECTRCGERHDPARLLGVSPCCAAPLYARYDLPALRDRFRPAALRGRRADLWRYAEVLPVRQPSDRLSLGEGFTPLIDAPRLAGQLGLRRLLIKDESQNPTASFKARGLAVAVSRARELGAGGLAIPSAGNAGAAAAAYAALAGMVLHVAVPRDTPAGILAEVRAMGARLELVDGVITDAAARIADGVRRFGWFDLSTLREPYRVEGKKTMGYELFEQLGGRLPDVIVYPTGGGTGLVGMWKAFAEMEALGWIGSGRPRMICVQAEGCAPLVRAWQDGAQAAAPWPDPRTIAWGLRVPRAIGDFLILDALRACGGAAVAVGDPAMLAGVDLLARTTGIYASPEGGATLAAVPLLLEAGHIGADEEVVLFCTGSGLKY